MDFWNYKISKNLVFIKLSNLRFPYAHRCQFISVKRGQILRLRNMCYEIRHTFWYLTLTQIFWWSSVVESKQIVRSHNANEKAAHNTSNQNRRSMVLHQTTMGRLASITFRPVCCRALCTFLSQHFALLSKGSSPKQLLYSEFWHFALSKRCTARRAALH